ncbi:MAG: VirB8/TrbF family protein [Sulfurovaceae bacterium]|nr:VirB8/TrbF family protein [Sulfurovaceae bacterium]
MSDKNKSVNPYLDGRREWNERYGSYISQAKNWRIFAFLSLLIALMAVAGVIYIGSQSKVKPVLVEIDKLGTPIEAREIPDMKVDQKVIKYALGDFITNYRTVYKSDPNIQKQMIYKAYKYLSDSLPAYTQISENYQNNSPFVSQFDKQIEIVSVLPLGEKTYQIDWIEKTIDRSGKTISIDKYRATANIVLKTPATEKDIMNNPVGLFIKDIAFQKTLN